MPTDVPHPSVALTRGAFMYLTVTEESDAVVIRPRGEIDVASAPTLADALFTIASDGAQPVVVDMAAVSFMDSTGLSTLINAHEELASKGLPLSVRNAAPAVRQVFGASGTERLFGLED